jgi:hypothetical protein
LGILGAASFALFRKSFNPISENSISQTLPIFRSTIDFSNPLPLKSIAQKREEQRATQRELEEKRQREQQQKAIEKRVGYPIEVLKELSGSAYWSMRKKYGNDAEIRNIFGTSV